MSPPRSAGGTERGLLLAPCRGPFSLACGRTTRPRYNEQRWWGADEPEDPFAAAIGRTLRQILDSPHFQVEPSEPYREPALELFWTRSAGEVDFSDCLSFALMAAKKVHRAFAYDADFEKAGFQLVG
jgi:hypothetical protein